MKKFFSALIVICLAVCSLLLLSTPSDMVFAVDSIIENSSTGIPDSALYNGLLLHFDSSVRPEKLSTDCLKNAGITTINLTDRNISSIQGLNRLDLSGVTSINLSLNDISILPTGVFLGATSLNTLDLSFNKLTGIVLNDLNVSSLYLNGNDLTIIDIQDNDNLSELDLSNNLFEDFDDIIMGSAQVISNVYLSSNYLTLIPQTLPSGCTFHFGLQGIKDGEQLVGQATLKFYDSGVYANVKAEASMEHSITNVEIGENTVLDSGVYTINFYDAATGIAKDVNNINYMPIDFTVVPDTSTVTLKSGDTTVSGIIYISRATDYTIVCTNSDYLVQYRLNSQDWTNGNTFTVDEDGYYNLFIRLVENGVSSSQVNFAINLTISGSFWSYLWFVFGFAIIGGLIGFGVFLRNKFIVDKNDKLNKLKNKERKSKDDEKSEFKPKNEEPKSDDKEKVYNAKDTKSNTFEKNKVKSVADKKGATKSKEKTNATKSNKRD